MRMWTEATKILQLRKSWGATMIVSSQSVPSVTNSLTTNPQHLKIIYSWVRQCYYSKERRKKRNWLKLRKSVRQETHVLYLGDTPAGARVTACHRHCKTHSTAFIGELRGSPHCPAALQRTFPGKAFFSWKCRLYYLPPVWPMRVSDIQVIALLFPGVLHYHE